MRKNIAFEALIARPWVTVAIALILIGITLIVGRHSFRATEEAAIAEFNQKQLVMAREAAGAIEMYFEFLAGAMKAIGREQAVAAFDEIETRQILAYEFKELECLGVNDIAVIDAKGIIRYNVAAHQLEGADFSWRKYFQTAQNLTSDDAYVIQSIEFKGVDVGKNGVLVGVPMLKALTVDGYPSNTFAGLTLCTLKLDTLTQKFVAPIEHSEGGHALLIDNEFCILWSPDKSVFGNNLLQESGGFPSFQRVLQRMHDGESGSAEYSFFQFDSSQKKYTNTRVENLIAFVPVKLGRVKWALGVWSPKKDARKLIQSAYVKQLFLVSLIIIITVIGSVYTIAISLRYTKTLENEVAVKTREFKESHQRLLTVLDSLDAGVYVADMESFEILFVNRSLREQFGDVSGKPCWQVLQTGQKGPCKFCTNKKLLSPEGQPTGVHTWEFQNTINGKWYLNHDRAIRWMDGRWVRLEIASDITDRKLVEIELRQAHQEMGTFCQIIKEISAQRDLDTVSNFLIKELQTILKTEHMILYIFSSDHSSLFKLSEGSTSIVKEPTALQTVAARMDGLEGVTIAPRKPFTPPLIPDSFPVNGRQTIIPLRGSNLVHGVFVVACPKDCLCEEDKLKLVALILEQVSGTLKRAVLHEEEIRALQSRIEVTSEFSGIYGKDSKMQVIYKLIEDIAPTDATVLIQGESGTGKELVARAIHRNSLRQDKPFVVINCSAYPSTLLESELFGHEKGAFTGAVRRKIGRFEQAHDGTVFLDEIGEISLSAQIKLLRVLQTQKFERLGGEQTTSVNVRILAATNKDLLQEVKEGHFREDLFYRLNVIPINLPPLKQRRNDIPLLAEHFQRRFASGHGLKAQELSSEVMRRLLDYHWPGNVRELENTVEHAVVLSKGSRIQVSHLPSSLCEASVSTPAGSSDTTIVENEKKLLMSVLKECNWNKSRAAIRLGISRSTLYDKIKKYQVSKPRTK
jgi:two-component system response regulator HydG